MLFDPCRVGALAYFLVICFYIKTEGAVKFAGMLYYERHRFKTLSVRMKSGMKLVSHESIEFVIQ